MPQPSLSRSRRHPALPLVVRASARALGCGIRSGGLRMTSSITGRTAMCCPSAGDTRRGIPPSSRRTMPSSAISGSTFLIMDDTNCAGNDGGRINDNIRAWFDFMDARPEAERIPICIGGGGEMRASGKAGPAGGGGFLLGSLGPAAQLLPPRRQTAATGGHRQELRPGRLRRSPASPSAGPTTVTIMPR